MTRPLDKLMEMLATQSGSSREGCWHPAADVYRTPRGWLVKFDLAGVPPTDLQLERSGRRLTVSGSRRDALVQQGLCSYSLEIKYNRFERSVELPAEIDAAQIATEYRDGMLLVWLDWQDRLRTDRGGS